MTLRRLFHFPLLFAALACVLSVSSSTHAATDDAAQRQLREDRERFSREVERQNTQAKIRDDQSRAAADEQRTREELERLRVRQSNQTTETTRIKQRLDQQSLPTHTTSPYSVPAPVQPAAITPDFSVTFLADGNCVLYVKGRAPEVKSPADVSQALQRLLNARESKSTTPTTAP